MREFGESYELPCQESSAMVRMVKEQCQKHSIIMDNEVFAYMHEFPGESQPKQMELFSL